MLGPPKVAQNNGFPNQRIWAAQGPSFLGILELQVRLKIAQMPAHTGHKALKRDKLGGVGRLGVLEGLANPGFFSFQVQGLVSLTSAFVPKGPST